MSELKIHHINEVIDMHNLTRGEMGYSFVYYADEADKVIAHQKFKRCLAMAYVEWLKQMILCNHPESILYRRAARRELKWKEMAQKFKEAK